MNKTTEKRTLDQVIGQLLQEQIKKESQASRDYLAMAMWCDIKGYQGATSLLYNNANEERDHMLKITSYLIERGTLPTIPQHEPITPNYTSLHELFKTVLVQEQQVTQAIHHLVHTCLAKQDYTTFNFLQWFVTEQREEEEQAERVLELFDIIGQEGIGLYTIDEAIGKLNKDNIAIA